MATEPETNDPSMAPHGPQSAPSENITGATPPSGPPSPPDPQAAEGKGPLIQQEWTKICPQCSVQSTTAGEFCPNCGASYLRGRRRRKLGKKAIAIIVAIVILAGTGVGISLGVQHSREVAAQEAADKKADEAAAAREREAEEERIRVQEEAEAAAAAATAERALRGLIVDGLEESVQKDATERAAKGTITGPIERTECTPLGGGSVDDLTAITGTFECIAVNEKLDDGSERGYVFSATVNWDEASYTWHLGR